MTPPPPRPPQPPQPPRPPRLPRNQVRGSNPAPKGPPTRPAILGEYDGVVVVDKPAGIVTADKDPTKDSVLTHVKRWLKATRPDARAWVVHRLDKDASGLVLFATTPDAYAWLKEDLRAHRVRREYTAIVHGVPDWPKGAERTLADQLLDGPEHRTVRVATGPGTPHARNAVTHARVLAIGKGRAMLSLRLETGRRHQLRVQLAHAGHPIVGDRLYGPAAEPDGQPQTGPRGKKKKPTHKDRTLRLCLHASRLTLHHPATGQELVFQSPPPPRFLTLVGQKAEQPQETNPTPTSTPTPTTTADRADRADKPRAQPNTAQGWDHVAAWYDRLVGEGRSDHHSAVIIPGALRLLDLRHGERLLDVACGEGVLSRAAAGLGVRVTGVDAAGRLIDAAAKRAGPNERYLVGDARNLETLGLEPGFDAAACVMALMNIDAMEAVFRGVAGLLRPGGRFVAVVLHPAFRAPGQTAWQWDEPEPPHANRHAHPPPSPRQYRRVDGYLTEYAHEIVMNPGAAARGRRPITTTTFHRPIQASVSALARTGFAIDALEEWPSQRSSEPGPRASEENRARREIPLFLAWRALRR